MLIRYKKNQEKIAMGLLSFMPEEKDIKRLQQTIKEYETNPNWHLYLWKEEDVLGAIGLKIEDDINAVIQHISVNPSYRNMGIGKKMVRKIMEMYQGKYAVCADELTQQFFNKCDDPMPEQVQDNERENE
ncbi:GNAT family N-acetyltransferase [Ornithinibacillus gellani]|uniref:GNAT family N-acetyltransferase n=1 Tax=Ornithinibacillus gellani TaxID=2293253 RepID=UPI000F4A95EB|nr:GNAT family N-acetyltransferase [Ornithinibacillus gellani]TQS74456.1 GNAT family N-acetyltransferase [Ornithinibacillus gellani]